MIEQNGSDPMSGKEVDADDEDIIELTDEITSELPAEDEEILELTEEVTAAQDEEQELEFDLDLGGDTEDDEEIIELTDVAAGARDEAPALEFDLDLGEDAGDDEEIIELTDAAAGARDEAPALEFNLDLGEESDDDEEIIELTDAATDVPDEEPEFEFDLDKGGEAEDEEDADLTEAVGAAFEEPVSDASPETMAESEIDEEDLLSLLSDEPETAEEAEPEMAVTEGPLGTASSEILDFQEQMDAYLEEDLPQKDVELVSTLGIQLDPSRDLSMGSAEDDIEVEMPHLGEEASKAVSSFVIPREHLESAIERVIESKLSEKIDALLTSAIEKAVTAEINRIKRLLSDSLSDQ